MVSTQPFADAHVLAQPALSYPKLVEPTSKPVESKPPCTHPRTHDRACCSAAGWFRHGPLVPRDPAQPAFPDPKLVEPTSEPVEWPRTGQPHPRVGTVYRAPEMVSTQPFADAHVLAQPALSYPKLVEPTSKPVESKPPCTHPRTHDRACCSAAGWFRHGPLVPRDPAQPASGTMGSGSQLVGAVPLPATGSGRRTAPQFDGGADLADR